MVMVFPHLYGRVVWGEAGLCPLPVLLFFPGLAGKVVWGFGTGICLSCGLALPSQIVLLQDGEPPVPAYLEAHLVL